MMLPVRCRDDEHVLQAASGSIEGTLVRTLAIRSKEDNTGLAVNADGTCMVVSLGTRSKIAVYRLPDGAFQGEFGDKGVGAVRFQQSSKVCFSPQNQQHIFIADSYNKRIQVRLPCLHCVAS